MKHKNNSLNEPFYHLYLLLHIINIILHTLPPIKEKFLKAVMKELQHFFLHPGPGSPFHLFSGITHMTT